MNAGHGKASKTDLLRSLSNLHLHNTHFRNKKIKRRITKLEFADKCRLGPCIPLFQTTVIARSIIWKV